MTKYGMTCGAKVICVLSIGFGPWFSFVVAPSIMDLDQCFAAFSLGLQNWVRAEVERGIGDLRSLVQDEVTRAIRSLPPSAPLQQHTCNTTLEASPQLATNSSSGTPSCKQRPQQHASPKSPVHKSTPSPKPSKSTNRKLSPARAYGPPLVGQEIPKPIVTMRHYVNSPSKESHLQMTGSKAANCKPKVTYVAPRQPNSLNVQAATHSILSTPATAHGAACTSLLRQQVDHAPKGSSVVAGATAQAEQLPPAHAGCCSWVDKDLKHSPFRNKVTVPVLNHARFQSFSPCESACETAKMHAKLQKCMQSCKMVCKFAKSHAKTPRKQAR